jgi:hypothetical protein
MGNAYEIWQENLKRQPQVLNCYGEIVLKFPCGNLKAVNSRTE